MTDVGGFKYNATEKRNLEERYPRIYSMQRPEFDNIKDYDEFSKYYWYRDELIKICRDHGLKAPSIKIELNKVIEAYFHGERILPEKRQIKKKKPVMNKVTGLLLLYCH